MNLNERQSHILQGLVREYIATARPVGSAYLTNSLALAVSSATVRGVLQALEDAGYIYQPHPSAGRVPTDKGYRYYVDVQPQDDISGREIVRACLALYHDGESPPRIAAKVLPHFSHTLAILGWPRQQTFQEVGLAEFVAESTNDELETIREASYVLSDIDEHLAQLADDSSEQVTVYIGRENPLFPAEYTSMIVRSIKTDHDEVVVALLGPKRMPYNRNMALLEAFTHIFKETIL